VKIRDKQRLGYLAAFLLLVTAEVLIALLVHDAFIRPYFGDVLVVVVIYCFLRVLFPSGVRLLPLYVFLFAATIEGLQYFDLVHLLHLDGSRFFRILLGSVFDWADIACYAAGGLLLGLWEVIRYRRQHAKGGRIA
jgi:hypothetical protein